VRSKPPFAYFNGHEAKTPGHIAIPETRHREQFSGGRSEFDGDFDFGKSGCTCSQRVFPTGSKAELFVRRGRTSRERKPKVVDLNLSKKGRLPLAIVI
jgi:hypothetical protein